MNMRFNAEQSLAINEENGCVVLAPPGSGKTGTIVEKAIRIVRASPSRRVCLMTFTKAATEELAHRLRESLTAPEMKRVTVTTFHSLCLDMLRKAGKLGQMVGPRDVPRILQKAIIESDYDGSFEEAGAEVDRLKQSLDFTGLESPLIQAYQAILRRHRACDLNDVVRVVVQDLLGVIDPHGDPSRRVVPLNVTDILTDEVQDSDRIQFEFLIAHAAANIAVTIVGDDDQSIYAFRGSMGYEGMVEFEQRTGARRILLAVNYRSHAEILTAAAAVIRNNTARVAKDVLAAKGPGGKVQIVRVPSRAQECKAIADLICDDYEQLGIERDAGGDLRGPVKRWAIIARTNSAFRLIVGELKSRGIAYQRLGKDDDIPDDAMILMSFLCSLQTSDSMGVELMLSRVGIDPTAVKALITLCGPSIHTFLDGKVPELDRPRPEDAKALRAISDSCARWRRLLEEGHFERVIDGVADFFLNHGLVQSKTPDEDFVYWVNLLKRSRGSLSRRTDRLLRKKPADSTAGVTLVTMHSSKGLEFEKVIIAQANEGTIPSTNNSSVDEERRLFFVGMTRAKKELTVMFQTVPGPSQFISEMMPGMANPQPIPM